MESVESRDNSKEKIHNDLQYALSCLNNLSMYSSLKIKKSYKIIKAFKADFAKTLEGCIDVIACSKRVWYPSGVPVFTHIENINRLRHIKFDEAKKHVYKSYSKMMWLLERRGNNIYIAGERCRAYNKGIESIANFFDKLGEFIFLENDFVEIALESSYDGYSFKGAMIGNEINSLAQYIRAEMKEMKKKFFMEKRRG